MQPIIITYKYVYKNVVESEVKKIHIKNVRSIKLHNDNNDNEMKCAVESASEASHRTLMVAFVDFKEESINP